MFLKIPLGFFTIPLKLHLAVYHLGLNPDSAVDLNSGRIGGQILLV